MQYFFAFQEWIYCRYIYIYMTMSFKAATNWATCFSWHKPKRIKFCKSVPTDITISFVSNEFRIFRNDIGISSHFSLQEVSKSKYSFSSASPAESGSTTASLYRQARYRCLRSQYDSP